MIKFRSKSIQNRFKTQNGKKKNFEMPNSKTLKKHSKNTQKSSKKVQKNTQKHSKNALSARFFASFERNKTISESTFL
jgi:hypothetical protein